MLPGPHRLSLLIYNAALAIASGLLPPLLLGSLMTLRGHSRWARVLADIWPRLGLYPRLGRPPGGPRVWLQAVSLGEVKVAFRIAQALWPRLPELHLTVSSATASGLAEARRLFGARAQVIPFPLDLPWPVLAAAARVRPHVYASLETEIWPNLLAALQAKGASLLLLNGRISPRSFPGYRRLRWLVAPSLCRFSALSMISPADAARARALGAPA